MTTFSNGGLQALEPGYTSESADNPPPEEPPVVFPGATMPYSPVWYTPVHPLRFQGLAALELEAEAAAAISEARPAEPVVTGRFLGLTREFIETVILAVLIFLAVRASLQNFRVEGISMSPSLHSEQHLIVSKVAYARIDLDLLDWLPFYDSANSSRYIFGGPSRGDIVVFQAPNLPSADFIKRIIGEPGDTIEIDERQGIVFVNGQPLDEPYTGGRTSCANGPNPCGPWVVPPNYYFVLGDNRQNSTDSRVFGFVSEGNIIGRALLSYWPLDDFGLPPNE